MRILKNFKKNNILLDPDEVLADSSGVFGSEDHLEGKIEKPIGYFYSFLFILLAASGIFYLVSRAAFLQIESGEGFFTQSQKNRFSVRRVFAPRGILYDYYGKPLVENAPSFGLVLDTDKFLEQKGNWTELKSRLANIFEDSSAALREIDAVEERDLSQKNNQVFLVRNIASEKVISVAASADFLPGVSIFESFRRSYGNPFAFSHLLGFTGKVSAADLSSNPELNQKEVIGKNGIEAFYDDLLRGQDGRKMVEVDAEGKEGRFKFLSGPKEGSRLRLAIDGDLQQKSYEILDSYIAGNKGASVVAVDPRNGAIRVLISYPGFDINSFGSSLSQEEFDRVLKNPLKPMFNRAVGGEFPSGSTIKPMIAAAALEEKIIDPDKKIYDEGFIEVPNPYRPGEKSIFVDWKKHGWVDFYDAIAQSANVYFYMIGGGYKDQKGLGIERIKKYAAAFGLGSRLGIDLPGEKSGFFPDPVSKPQLEPQDPIWRIGDTYNVSIGQGGVKVTPLQMAVLTATLVNGGKIYKPYILDVVLDEGGEIKERVYPELLRENVVNQNVLEEVIKGMRQTVTSGTARLLNEVTVSVGAKTGTAQAGSGLPHAWVTAFAPVENPEIAIVVMVEHAGEGSTVAVPITNEILKWYFSRK